MPHQLNHQYQLQLETKKKFAKNAIGCDYYDPLPTSLNLVSNIIWVFFPK
jgi:hypothetical protein